MNDNNISGKVYTEGFKESEKILVEVMSDSDVQLIKNFIETEGKGAFYIDVTTLGPGRGIRILACEESLMNIRGDVSQFMEENNIIGYTYISVDSNVITVVCNSNEDIEHIKAYVAEKCYRAERLEYTLPDFEVNTPDIAPTDLEEIRQILDDFIKQNGISGYTKIAPRKGEDKVWVMLDSVKDENYRKIELFMSLYGIDSDSVIIDGEVTHASDNETTENKNLASDDEFARWAIKDYQDKTGITAASAEVASISDEEYTIVLKDADGNILDTYTINPETGIGTDSSNAMVNLPQTGNNSTRNLLTAIGAVLMIVFGAVAVKFSGVLNRRKKSEK